MKKDEVFYKKLRELVIPITIQSFMLSLVSVTDAIMLGFVDQTSISAVSLAGQIQFILSMFVSGTAAGTGIMAAQYWGKRDVETIEKIVPIALRMNVIFGGLFTLAAICAPQVLMKIYTNEQPLIEAGGKYLLAVSLSYVLCGISQVYLTMLKNTGEAKLSSRISSVTVVLNIVLNAVLIFGLLGFPKLGIIGAAYATVISRAVELIWSILVTCKPERVKVRWSKFFEKEKKLTRAFWKYTFPVLGASLVWGGACSLYSVIIGHMGSDAVAANSIASIAKNMVSCLIRGVSGGTGILVGNLLGAGELEEAKRYAKKLTYISILVGMGTGLFLIAISPVIIYFLDFTEEAIHIMRYMMVICAVNVMFQSVNATVLDGVFCAGGDSKFDMIGNVFAMWSFSVPLGFIAAFALNLPVLAVFAIVNLDEIVKIPAVYHRYKRYIWVRNITVESE